MCLASTSNRGVVLGAMNAGYVRVVALIVSMVLLDALVAAARLTPKRECVRSCEDAVARCGDVTSSSPRRCRTFVLKKCRKSGVAWCESSFGTTSTTAVATTTTSTARGSVTTTTVRSVAGQWRFDPNGTVSRQCGLGEPAPPSNLILLQESPVGDLSGVVGTDQGQLFQTAIKYGSVGSNSWNVVTESLPLGPCLEWVELRAYDGAGTAAWTHVLRCGSTICRDIFGGFIERAD